MENNLTEIFIGSEIETAYISSILSDNDIYNIVENRLNQRHGKIIRQMNWKRQCMITQQRL